MRDRPLLDNERNRFNEFRMRLCATAAQVSLFYGPNNYKDRYVSQFWHYDDYYPSSTTIKRLVKTENVKWYIYNFMVAEDEVWNADFVYGLSKWGHIKIKKMGFNTFIWGNNDNIQVILDKSPFFGYKSKNWNEKNKDIVYSWIDAPILSAKHSEDSISFMAGVLATGKLYVDRKTKTTYVKYNSLIEPYLKKWGIPIEKRYAKYILISPFWTALLTPWMPEICKKWLLVKKPYCAEKYSLIMWRIFSNKQIKTDAIPFLMSRRNFFYKYGTVKNLEREWVQYKLVEADLRFKKVIKYWANEIV